MSELRRHTDTLPGRSEAEQRLEDQREAHMRLAIAAALKESDGAGRGRLRRLARAGAARFAGRSRGPRAAARPAEDQGHRHLGAVDRHPAGGGERLWRGCRVARLVRAMSGTSSSGTAETISPAWVHGTLPGARRRSPARRTGMRPRPAAVIEAVRLAETLAATARPRAPRARRDARGRPCHHLPRRDRAVAADRAAAGDRRCGRRDRRDVPQMPLQADLARQQRKLKLAPEALERDISLDLRSECRSRQIAAPPSPAT